MELQSIKENILRTLLYYDIFNHPLKFDEIYTFLPENTIARSEILEYIENLSSIPTSDFAQKDGFVYIKPNSRFVSLRLQKEKYSRKMWKAARLITHIIKRFPFVRAVLVSGSLSKNSSAKESDLDFMVITAKDRLWISRTLLMLFKKVFLLNSYKYFCINYFVTENNLEIEEKNIFTATEVAHIKATYNTELMHEFILANQWIRNYFPNYPSNTADPCLNSSGYKVNDRKSRIQKIFEIIFAGRLGNRINKYLLKINIEHWKKKYSYLEEAERNRIFKSTWNISRNHPGDMQKKILNEYIGKLKKFNLDYYDGLTSS